MHKRTYLIAFQSLISLFLALYISACQEPAKDNQQAVKEEEKPPSVERIINEMEGRLSKTIQYVLRVDSVNFTVEAALREDSTVAVKFNYYIPFSFEDHLIYQQQLLQEVLKDFDPGKITSIYLGRLIYTGDLAIRISNEVLQDEWDEKSYPELKVILEKGSLLKDFQQLTSSAGLHLKGVSFEKAFFINGEALSTYATITIPIDERPANILDCMAWLILE